MSTTSSIATSARHASVPLSRSNKALSTTRTSLSTSAASFVTSISTATSDSFPTQTSQSIVWETPASTVQQLAAAQQQPGFSEGSKRLLYATTIIGGTLLIAFLVYGMYRLHLQSARYHERRSILSPGPIRRARGFTTLQIHRTSRFSWRTSFRSGSAKGRVRIPSAVGMQHFRKPANPPSPLGQPSPIFYSEDKPPPLPEKPGQARVTISSRSSSGVPLNEPSVATENSKTKSSVNIRDHSSTEIQGGTPPGSPRSYKTNYIDRWSWTNSQAPTTPRFFASDVGRPPSRSSSAPRFQSVRSWIENQPVLLEERPREPVLKPQAPAERVPKKLLKNQASKPVLAPHPRAKPTLNNMFRSRSDGVKTASPGLSPGVRSNKGPPTPRK